MEQDTYNGGGQKGDTQIEKQLQPLFVFTGQPGKNAFEAPEIKPQNGNYGSDLDTYGISVGGMLFLLGSGIYIEKLLGEDDMAGGTHRKIFRDAFDYADYPRFNGAHGSLAGSGMDAERQQDRK